MDGTWDVQRTGGLLPPLLGVRKLIHGTRGRTIVGHGQAVASLRFDVVGDELRYHAPLVGLVDVVEPDGEDGYRGRCTLFGRTVGHFRMTPARGGAMSTVQEQLVKHLDEAYAMEQNVVRLLDGMIETTDDPGLRRELEHHRQETESHAEQMKERLRAHGASPSTVRQAAGILGAMAKMPIDLVRGEKAARNARDGFATEHMEIASYELLKRVAERAGDDVTVATCDAIIAQEREMAQTIAASWDTVAELSLREEGVTV